MKLHKVSSAEKRLRRLQESMKVYTECFREGDSTLDVWLRLSCRFRDRFEATDAEVHNLLWRVLPDRLREDYRNRVWNLTEYLKAIPWVVSQRVLKGQ